MYAKSKNKATKGTVQIKTSNGRLQLVFSHLIVAKDGEIKNKRFYFSTGQEDSPLDINGPLPWQRQSNEISITENLTPA